MLRDCVLLLSALLRKHPRSQQDCINWCDRQEDAGDVESSPELEACLAHYRRRNRSKS